MERVSTMNSCITFGATMGLLGMIPPILLLIMLLAEGTVGGEIESLGWAVFTLCTLDNIDWMIYFRWFYKKKDRCEKMKRWSAGSFFQVWCYGVGITQLFLLGWLTGQPNPFGAYGIAASVVKAFSLVFAHLCITRGLFSSDSMDMDLVGDGTSSGVF